MTDEQQPKSIEGLILVHGKKATIAASDKRHRWNGILGDVTIGKTRIKATWYCICGECHYSEFNYENGIVNPQVFRDALSNLHLTPGDDGV